VTGSGRRPEAADTFARGLATAVPVLVAVSVAFLYSLGAIELVRQTKEVHVDALAALPLVPLQQVLGRGIWVATYELPWMLAVGTLGIVLFSAGDPIGQPKSRRTRASEAVVALGFVFLLVLAPVMIARVLLTVVVGIFAALPFRERFLRGFAFNEIIAAAAVYAVLYAASGAVVTPDHLPVAKLRLETGSMSGALVAFDGSTWYIGGSGKIDAIPTRSVVSSRIDRVGRRSYKPLWRLF